jgi:DNA-binding response OmpR family regulator
MKILLVEDNAFTRKLLQKQLEAADYQVQTAPDGIAALNAIRADRPDIILLDIMMPRLDGYQVCKLLRLDDRFAGIPIIMLTSKAGQEDRDRGMEAGVDDFILKNAEFGLILKVIEEHS